MKRKTWIWLIASAALLSTLAGGQVFATMANKVGDANGTGMLQRQALAIFGKLPKAMPGAETDTPAMAALGKRLYFETALSINRTESCNTCHRLDQNKGGVDYLPTSKGAMGGFGSRNPPSTLNAGFQIAQFWDGRAADLEEQALGPMLNPAEMAMPTAKEAMARLRKLKGYSEDFSRAFPGDKDPMNAKNFAHAVAAFERTLTTKSAFDRFLDGDAGALTTRQKMGLQLFMDRGCVRCHSGPVMGGMLFQKIGIYHPYFDQKDMGRYVITKKAEDRYVFKVPVLRNIAITGPYFHDGRVSTLGEAVDLMAWMQLDQRWSREENHQVLRFLNSLTHTKRYQAPPVKVKTAGTWWQPRDPSNLPKGKQGDLIRRGFELVNQTNLHLGQGQVNLDKRYSGNTLDCRNCHLDKGVQRFGDPWVGVMNRYPSYRARKGGQGDIQDRINGCFQRSMNGRPLPAGSPEMKAIVTYMSWLSDGVPAKIVGQGVPKLNYPGRKANLAAGKETYATYCLTCHGSQGLGYQGRATYVPTYVVPPLAGPGSYNNGAGMDRLLKATAFIRSNMPLGATFRRPVLTNEQAYDIAGYLNSLPRPQMDPAILAKDYPDKKQKPVDSPYPPWADGFSADQHRYGPFQPMIKASEQGSTAK
ncbi:MAG: c-type cytochrome [Desulfarculaceae bacterium]|nr:c-type cytochrome [Desulfarculaceae bacterium]MCF8048217.1 c-type cytochrome [Desulfarculaceae bacterium]